MPDELKDRVAIVTGAGTGIGRGIAVLFAQEGANVVVTGRRKELLDETLDEIKAAGGAEAIAIPGDVSDEAEVDRLFEETASRFGPVDVLVNNAAIAGEIGNIWELSLDGWNETIKINLTGPWLCTRAAAKAMMPRRSGKIINIGSISGKRPLATRTPYTSSKLGLVGLTKTAAVELGEYGINVNNISPGAIETPRLAHLAEAWKMTKQELVDDLADKAATKRIGEPRDIAELALFLATDRSRQITGFDISVDGGLWFS
jgi:NAD(P)-dependent dehydrogenase (short-subunit alcohol dehydrogenase family)